MPAIRPLQEKDYAQWLSLWDGNNQGQRDEKVTAQTWTRLIDPAGVVKGLGAFEDDRLVGILHYVLHPTTGNIHPVCYMQDLYVDPAQRRHGIAKALLGELEKTGQRENWARIYWLAEGKNQAAQNLYKTLGVKLDFTLHVLPLGKI